MARLLKVLQRRLVFALVVVGGLAIWLPTPGRFLDHGWVIDATLAVLVFTAGLSVEVSNISKARSLGARMVIALVVSSVLLLALSWSLSHLVVGSQRDGVLALGVAPGEVATIAFVGLAAGDVAIAAVMVFGSTLVTLVLAGPLLGLMTAGHAVVHPLGLAVNLAVVVVVPLILGVVVGHRGVGQREGLRELGELVGLLTLLVLMVEVASELHLGAADLIGLFVVLVFAIGSLLVGMVVSLGMPIAQRAGVLLPAGIRDFAIAAGIATAAFGPSTIGLLGIYGLLALILGAIVTRLIAPGASSASA